MEQNNSISNLSHNTQIGNSTKMYLKNIITCQHPMPPWCGVVRVFELPVNIGCHLGVLWLGCLNMHGGFNDGI